MPTIDQLAPAAAASDTDELMISQNGISRKITRGQLVSGLQPQLTLPAGTLLGNPSAATAAPRQITIGANLTLAGGTLSASAVPYVVSNLPAGTVPASSDSVPLGQGGTNTVVSYGQFMSGLPNVANIDGSNLQVRPTGSGASLKLADLAAATALTTGSVMTGPLTLAADPAQPLQAATKQYVDSAFGASLPKTGGSMTGPLTLSANPTIALQAATKAYVDGQTSALLPKSGGVLSGALTLPSDPSTSLQAATKQYVDARVQRSGDAMTGPLSLASDPVTSLQAATKQYVDARVQKSGDIMSGTLTLSGDPAQPLQAATKQYVDARILRSGDTMTGALTLAADPTLPLQAATKQYADSQAATRLSTAGGTVTGAITLTGSGQNRIQNGSLYVGNSDFQHATFNTSGSQTAVVQKVGSNTTDSSVLQSFYFVNHSGGTGHVINNMAVGTVVTSSPGDGIWGFLTSLNSTSGGGNGGSTGHVAGYFQTVRGAVPIPASTITAAATGSTVHVADITNFFTGYSAAVGYPVSTTYPLAVTIGGKPYNVVQCTPDTPGATSGPGTLTLSTSLSAGDGAVGNSIVGQVTGANLWGGVIEYREFVDLPSSKSGYGQTLELDWFGNNADDADTRCLISAVVGKHSTSGTDVEVSNVLGVWPGTGATPTSGASIKRGLQINVPFSQAVIDTRNGTQKSGANAIWLANGHKIALSSDGSRTISFDTASGTTLITGPTRFAGLLQLSSYTVATLPASATAGAKAYASNGRKNGEAAGTGTGVEVFADNSGRWISVLSGAPVQA